METKKIEINNQIKKKYIAPKITIFEMGEPVLAAEAIQKAAEKRGYDCKIETQGSDGIQNELTAEDIAEADVILLSTAITPQNMERFEGYEIYEVSLSEAIKNPDGVIQEIEDDLNS